MEIVNLLPARNREELRRTARVVHGEPRHRTRVLGGDDTLEAAHRGRTTLS